MVVAEGARAPASGGVQMNEDDDGDGDDVDDSAKLKQSKMDKKKGEESLFAPGSAKSFFFSVIYTFLVRCI